MQESSEIVVQVSSLDYQIDDVRGIQAQTVFEPAHNDSFRGALMFLKGCFLIRLSQNSATKTRGYQSCLGSRTYC